MKKFLAIFLVFTLLFAFAACNKNEVVDENSTTQAEQTTDESTTRKKPNFKEEKTTAEPFVNPNLTEPANLFKVINVNDYDFKESKPNTFDSSGVTMLMKRYTFKGQSANALPDSISVGSSKFVFMQTTLKEILAQGWTLIGKSDVNQAVKSGETANILIKNGQEEVLKIKVLNKTANIVAAGDCVINEAGVVKSVKNQYSWVDFTFGDTTNTNSSYAEIVSGLGNPAKVNVVEYYKGKDDLNRCNATLVYEYKSGDTTYNISIAYEDNVVTATLESFNVTAK